MRPHQALRLRLILDCANADNGDMPCYVYRTPEGRKVELVMTVAEMERRQVDGVIEHEGQKLTRDIAEEWSPREGNAFCGAKWPILSDSAGVHPDEIPQAREEMRRKGVNIDYAGDGRAIFESHAHRRAALKAMGLHEKRGYA